MHRFQTRVARLLSLLVLATPGCNKVYTQADLAEEEQKFNAAADSEEAYDRGIEEEGGVNEVLIERAADGVITNSDR